MISTNKAFGVGVAATGLRTEVTVRAAHAAMLAATAKHRAAATDASVNRGST